MGESGWTSPLPLESNTNTEAPEDFNIKPVLIRARIPEWGTVHEMTARLELVGNGFERTLVSQRWLPRLFQKPLLFSGPELFCLPAQPAHSGWLSAVSV